MLQRGNYCNAAFIVQMDCLHRFDRFKLSI
jgi:hypothetical protein